jgi:TolB protein
MSYRQGARDLLIVIGALACVPNVVRAQDTTWREGVRIEGTWRRTGVKPGVLVLPISGRDGDSLRAMFNRDFDNGDRLTAIDLPAAQVPPPNANGTLNYPLYAQLGANVLLQVTPVSYGVTVAIHDVARGGVARSSPFPLPTPSLGTDWRVAVHTIADGVEQQLTGVRGISATRILYVSGGRVFQIDSDGANPTPLTPAVGAMSPTWNPKGSHIAYTTLTNDGARVVLREVGGALRTLGTGRGMSSSPAFSPDGNLLVYAYAEENGTDLVAVNAFASEPPRRVTVGRGSENTSPTFSPDGRRIAYTTNRLGRVEVYVSDADGTNAGLLMPFADGSQSYRSDPDWSPDGRLVAFQSQIGGNFQIMTVSVREGTVNRHTSTGVNENASFAPDSRHIVFTSTRSGARQLWVVDIESGRLRQLTHAAAGAKHGSWSPSLKLR